MRSWHCHSEPRIQNGMWLCMVMEEGHVLPHMECTGLYSIACPIVFCKKQALNWLQKVPYVLALHMYAADNPCHREVAVDIRERCQG